MPSRREIPDTTGGGAESLAPSLVRSARAYALHQCGFTFEQIGQAMGIGRNQARVLCLKYRRHLWALEKLRENPDDILALGDTGQLSRRLAHALHYHGIETVPQMAALDEQDWRRIPLIGPASIAEAMAFLTERYGVPDQASEPEHGMPI
jgi:hypothetical protein